MTREIERLKIENRKSKSNFNQLNGTNNVI